MINEVTTKTAKSGDLFALIVDAPVAIGDRVVIAQGVRAVGRSGKLVTRLVYLEMNGTRLVLDGDPRTAGKGGTDQVLIATLGLTSWGLFARGNNAKLKAGDIVVGSLAEDYTQPTPRPSPPALPVADPAPPS